MESLTTSRQNGRDKFDDEEQIVWDIYAADICSNKGTFAAWVIANEPLWGVYRKQWMAANNALQQYMLQVFWAESDQLQSQGEVGEEHGGGA